MRKLAVVCALTALVLLTFALAQRQITAQAASNPGNLTLASVTNRAGGCALGPAYTFCDRPPGTASQPEAFFISSPGAVTGVAVALQPISGLSANFAAGDFTISGNTCTGNLAAGAQCEIDVEFSPAATGLRQAALAVTDAAGDALNINIEGTGNNLALAPPYGVSLGAPDNSFNYGGVPAGTAGTAQTFTVTAGAALTQINVSLAAIPGLESQFTAGGVDFAISNNTCGALAAGASCTLNAAFTPSPTSIGLRSAALIATDAQGDSTTIYLSGYGNNGHGGATQAGGLTFNFAAASANSAPCSRANYFGFCNQPAGGVSPQSSTFTLRNTSGAQVTGLTVPTGSVIAQGATAPDFTIQGSSCTTVLAAGSSCNITVAFTPTTNGLRQGVVNITDAQGDLATVNLAGVGDDYSIAPQLPTEISVIPGATGTFNATLTPDNVLGMNGEQVTFNCPANLPGNTSCIVTPCPATITPGTPVNVKVAIATSTALKVAPVPPQGCSSYGFATAALIGAPDARPAPPATGTALSANKGSPILPALLILGAFGVASLLVFGLADWRQSHAARVIASPRWRIPLILVCAGLAAAILAGCHHHSAVNTTETPTGETVLTVHGAALDANGNSLNTSRQFQVTLDVVSK